MDGWDTGLDFVLVFESLVGLDEVFDDGFSAFGEGISVSVGSWDSGSLDDVAC